MPKPNYPTKEGLWSKGKRAEEKYAGVKLDLPYTEAVDSLRGALQDRDDFDPAVLFVWGTMQATGVLNILKAVEEKFGEEGQIVVRQSVRIQKQYKNDRGEWQNTDYYFPEELAKLESLVRKAFDFITVKESGDAGESIPV